MRIFVNFTSPLMPVWINGGTYNLNLNGIDIGNGAIGEILATATPSVTTMTLNATLSSSYSLAYTTMLFDYALGENITMKMTIKTITVLGFITLSPNYVVTQEINQNSQ